MRIKGTWRAAAQVALLAALLGTVASGCGVGGVTDATGVTHGWREDPAASRQVDPDPVGFTCAGMDFWAAEPRPVFPDGAAQRRIEQAVAQASGPGWRVLMTMSSHLGVVALVDGDVGAARAALAPRGVAQVLRPARSPEVTFGDQIDRLQAALLGPEVTRLERALQDRPGWGAVTPWEENEAVVIQWKAPVPAYVRSMTGRRPDGVHVAVLGTRYSDADLRWAAQRIHGAAESVDATLTRVGPCDDLSGLSVGIPSEDIRAKKAEVTAELTHLAGLPVQVVAYDRTGPVDAA